jgi:threonine dehydrogenase-like Zn-dependent dehydrogenase
MFSGDSAPDPKIQNGRNVIIKVTSCAICGSDLHLMGGLMPTMKSGDIVGHEFMGEVIDTGSAHNKFRKGDRIVVPVNINATNAPCKLGDYSVCQRSNRAAAMVFNVQHRSFTATGPVQRPLNCATANLRFHLSRLRGRRVAHHGCLALELRIQSRDSIELGFRHLR